MLPLTDVQKAYCSGLLSLRRSLGYTAILAMSFMTRLRLLKVPVARMIDSDYIDVLDSFSASQTSLHAVLI